MSYSTTCYTYSFIILHKIHNTFNYIILKHFPNFQTAQLAARCKILRKYIFYTHLSPIAELRTIKPAIYRTCGTRYYMFQVSLTELPFCFTVYVDVLQSIWCACVQYTRIVQRQVFVMMLRLFLESSAALKSSWSTFMLRS